MHLSNSSDFSTVKVLHYTVVLWLGTVYTVQLNLNVTHMCQYMHELCVKLEHIVS